jgi:hypothetical protein
VLVLCALHCAPAFNVGVVRLIVDAVRTNSQVI